MKSRLFFSFAFPVFIFGGGGLLKEAYFSQETMSLVSVQNFTRIVNLV